MKNNLTRILGMSIMFTVIILCVTATVTADEVNMQAIGSCDTPNNACDIFVSGDYAYVADDLGGLVIINIADPESPQIEGIFDTDTGRATEVVVYGNYAYVANGVGGFWIIDVSDPTSPTLAARHDYPQGMDVDISNNYAYLAGNTRGFYIYDISDPTSPVILSRYAYSGYLTQSIVIDNYVYLAGNRLVLDVSDPTSPKSAGSFDIGADAQGYAFYDKYLYVAGKYGGLYVYDLTNPTSPSLIFNYDTVCAWDIFIEGEYAYLADGWDGDFKVFNIQNPELPILAGTCSALQPMGVSVVGNYIYIADSWNGLLILDSDVPSPNNAPKAVISSVSPNPADEGTIITFNASGSSDPEGDTLNYRWDFDNNGTWTEWSTEATATYIWNDEYTGTVTLEVSDGEFSDVVTTEITVNNVAPTVTLSGDLIDENGTATINGVITDPGIDDSFAAIIDWGDGNSETIRYPAGTTVFTKTHQYLDDDPSVTPYDNYIVNVEVSDGDGGISAAASMVTVNNVAPEITSLSTPIDPIAVNEPVSISSEFIDIGTLDTHTVIIDWGDSSVDAVELVSLSSLSTDQTSHSYLDAGVYRITLTVTDDDSGFDTITSEQYVVIYDSDAGFVTGGGWIDSPSGAYTPDSALVGKATFGFVSKYKKGATTPTGNTEFQFQVADLNFKSTSYDWLVIAGQKAQYKGTGTINGEGNYGFMLTAIDAELTPSTDDDLFRIKIWDKDNDGEIIYDNMLDADETADPTTAIQGGSIKIHKEK